MYSKVIASIKNQYFFNLVYAKKLVADLSNVQMTVIPCAGLENHPAFTIGHLISGSAMIAEELGAEFKMPDGWADLFLRNGPGDPRHPDPDISKYPSKDLLIEELENQHNKVSGLLEVIDEKKLGEEIKWRFGQYMPTLVDLITFMCINHEAMHLSQLSAWRRAMGLSSALADIS